MDGSVEYLFVVLAIEANEELRINWKINPLISSVPSEGTVVKLANNSDAPSNGTQRDYW